MDFNLNGISSVVRRNPKAAIAKKWWRRNSNGEFESHDGKKYNQEEMENWLKETHNDNCHYDLI